MTRVLSVSALLIAMLVVSPATLSALDYSEAPMLAAAVAQGDLPPLEQRLPPEPMVVKPVGEIGRYGGTWHRMMKGSSDFHAYGRLVYALAGVGDGGARSRAGAGARMGIQG